MHGNPNRDAQALSALSFLLALVESCDQCDKEERVIVRSIIDLESIVRQVSQAIFSGIEINEMGDD